MTHQWREYDPFHRACERCGLRVFMRHQDGRVRGWQTVDWRGVPGPLVLGAQAGGWGDCVLPPTPPIADAVIIEYTGDPDQHPGCERVMHAVGGPVERERSHHVAAPAGLVVVTELAPACGVLPQWWELGKACAWVGWNWCAECFPTREPHHVPPSEQAKQRAAYEAAREAKAEARRLAAAEAYAAKRAAAKAAEQALRYGVPPRWCLACGRARGGALRIVRVKKGELAGLVLLLCSRCAPRKG